MRFSRFQGSFVFVTMLLMWGFGYPSQPEIAASPPPEGRVNSETIERIFGVEGQWKGDVFQVTFPRTDLGVEVSNVAFPAGMGLTSWLSFKSVGEDVVVAGDLTLLADEVNPVISRLLKGGIEVTALHNHLLWEEPRIMYMHVMGRGSEQAMSEPLKAALDLLGKGDAGALPSSDSGVSGGLEVEKIEEVLGLKGVLKGGVHKVVVPRKDLKVMMSGVEMDSSMGVNSWMAFHATPQGAVVDGDFAMLEGEVAGVIRLLRRNGINVLAVHNHMLGEQPRIIFLHYWGEGKAVEMARGLKEALEVLGKHPH